MLVVFARRHWLRLLPFIGSLGMLLIVGNIISWSDLSDGFSKLPVINLAWATIAVVGFAYLWDCACITRLFADVESAVSYVGVLRTRGLAYLLGIVNWALGQGMMVLVMSRLRRVTMGESAGRFVAMAYFDLLILLLLGTAGIYISGDSRLQTFGLLIGSLLAIVIAGLFVFRHSTLRLGARMPGGILRLFGWDWRRIGTLVGLRAIYFLGGIVFLRYSLAECGLVLNFSMVVGVMAVMAVTDALPLSFGGFGSRELTMLALLDPPNRGTIIAFCLFWSSAMILLRSLIGLACLWNPTTRELFYTPSTPARSAREGL